MPNFKDRGRLLLTAALAASTTLTGPTFAVAEQRGAIRLAQASDDLVAPTTEPSEAETEQPAPSRRERRQRSGDDAGGAASSGESGETPRRQRREAQPSEAETEQPATSRRERRQRAGEESEGATPSEDAGETPRRQRREAQPSEAETEQPAPSRRERRQRAGEEAEGATPSEDAGETPRRERRNRQSQETAPAASEPSATEESQAPARRNRNAEPATETPGAAEQPAASENEGGANRRQRARTQAGEPAATQTAPAEPTSETPASRRPGAAPAGETTPATPDSSAPAATPAQTPAGEVPASPPASGTATTEPGATAAPGAPDATTAVPGAAQTPAARGSAPADGTATSAPSVAPVQGTSDNAQAPSTTAPPPAASLRPQPVPADVQNAPIRAGEVGQSDARVQTLQQPVEVRPITQERGERTREALRYERRPDTQVVRRVGDREILSLGAAAAAGAVAGAAAGYFVRSNDEERLGVDASDRYSERLARGRNRETIVRPNGVQVVTISNRYGDVIQRSRVLPDGQEVVLFYDPYSEEGQRRDYYEDPGRDLPPIRVDIPDDEYVVDTAEPDDELYYDTLVAPPVETVERIYSVDEVRRSTRIRDKVRRIDLATINFAFGSAEVAQEQVDKLQGLADAIQKVVKDNPGETFLIEGHTDAVGSDVSNLALSDQRAEAVAAALTEYFELPAENLVTQGYGEQELKVNTEGESAENRRVTVRRITALVKPVATSEAR